MNDVRTKFWDALKSLNEELKTDRAVARRFEEDPIRLLREKNVDIEVPMESGMVKFSNLLENLSNNERKATLASLIEISTIPDFERPAVMTPIANANVGANANANANANVNANANANVNGMTAEESLIDMSTIVTLPSDYDASAFAKKMNEMKMNEPRQKALLKRALSDPDSLISARTAGDAEIRTAKYAFRGVVFEVEGLLRNNQLLILKAEIVV